MGWGNGMRSGCTVLAVAAVFLALSAGTASRADPGPAAVRWDGLAETTFDHLGRANGLVHDYITALAQDRSGFLWIGTEGGLARYDGYRFRTYKRDVDSDQSLPDNFVLSLHVDQAGRLWVGTQSGGLARYDDQTDRFVRVPTCAQGLSSPEITAIADDGAGGLWIGTWAGLNRLDPATGAVHAFRHNGADPTSLPHDQVWSLLRDRAGTLWVGTAAGLARLTPDGAGFASLPPDDPVVAKALADSISSLFEDASGRIWVGTFRNGVLSVDPASGHATALPEPPGGLHGAEIESIAAIDSGGLWFGTDGAGISSLDVSTGRKRLLQHNPLVPASVVDDHVNALLRDRSGLVWVGTQNGLDRYDPSTAAVTTVFGGPGQKDGISDPQVVSLAAAKTGLVWLGLGDQGIEVLDPASHRIAAIRPDPANPDKSLPGGSTNALSISPDGSAWIGTDHGLYHADPLGRSVTLVKLEALRPTPRIRSLLALRDEVWIGTQDGLLRYRIGLKEVRVYPADPDGTSGLTDGRILVILPDSDGRLWIGTEHGLNRLDPESGRVERFLPDPTDRASLSNSVIMTLVLDRGGRLWVGSAGGGIDVLESDDEPGKARFRHLGTREGLPDSLVDAILLDADGRIWATTDNRMAVIDPATFTVTPMLAAEGVHILTYWQQSAVVTPQEELVFGGSGGLTVIRPDQLAGKPPPPPPLVVTDARVGHRSVPSGPFNRAGGPEPIALPPEDRGFQLEFAGLDLAAPDRERYAYWLEGFDSSWVDAPQRVATYTNLPPGAYRLHIRVSDREAGWVEPLAPLPIHVQAALYETLWFKAALGVAGVLVISLLFQARTSSLRRRRAELQVLVEQRTAELVAANERLEALATTDGLTGVVNRRRFMELAGQELDRCRRLGHPLSIGLADLDDFKRINDRWGHLTGDSVLRTTACRFRDECRRIDTLARYGGEEFILLMPETGPEAALSACERLRQSLAKQPIPVDGNELEVTVSIGIAPWTGGNETLEELIDRADKALYAAKKMGKNRIETASATPT